MAAGRAAQVVARMAAGGAAQVALALAALAAAAPAASRGASAACDGRCELGREHLLLQLASASPTSSPTSRPAARLAPPMESPCERSCPCWDRLADGHTCGARIEWVAGPLGSHPSHGALAAGLVRDEFPSVCSCSVGGGPAESSAAAEFFEPLDSGVGQACRGVGEADDDKSYYELREAASLESCQVECLQMPACAGVEWADYGRCELWTREGGIRATVPVAGYTCLRLRDLYGRPEFLPVDGGAERACRGQGREEEEGDYMLHMGVASLEACQSSCRALAACVGVEFGEEGGRCEVWTRPGGIVTSEPAPGHTCLRRLALPEQALPEQGEVLPLEPVPPEAALPEAAA